MAAVRLRVEARTDARTSVECEIDARTDSVGITHAGERVDIPDVGVKGSAKVGAQVAIIAVNEIRLGGSRIGDGELRFSATDGALSGHMAYDLDIAQAMDYTRRLVPAPTREVLASLQQVTGRAQGNVKLDLGQPNWSVGVDVRQSDVAVRIRDLPGPLRLAGGAVEIDRHRREGGSCRAVDTCGRGAASTLRHSFKDGATMGGASFDLDVARWLNARRALPPENRDALADIQTAGGRVQGNARFCPRPRGLEGWRGRAEVGCLVRHSADAGADQDWGIFV
jgi:hypothetical protein